MIKDTYFKINGKDYPSRLGFACFMEFEDNTGISPDKILMNMSIKKTLQLFECAIISGCMYNKVKYDLEFEDIVKAIEDNDGYFFTFSKMIREFFSIPDKDVDVVDESKK